MLSNQTLPPDLSRLARRAAHTPRSAAEALMQYRTLGNSQAKETMRAAFVAASGCDVMDTTIARKLDSQLAFSGGEVRFPWYPRSFTLPADRRRLVREHVRMLKRPGQHAAAWVLKRPGYNRGTGVMTLMWREWAGGLEPDLGVAAAWRGPLVVQQYIQDPLTISGFKWHFRWYALVEAARGLIQARQPSSQMRSPPAHALYTLHVFRRAAARFATSRCAARQIWFATARPDAINMVRRHLQARRDKNGSPPPGPMR